MKVHPPLSAALGAVSLLALTACGTATPPPAKDGGSARPLDVVAVAYTTNSLTGETLAQLGTDLAEASGGAISIEEGPPVDAGAQDGSSDVIGMVRDGDADLGIVASRTFDLEGATSLQALNAPLVFESPGQVATFLADPVTDRMLDGLERAGVVGLALTYDQMRQPLGFRGPLTPTNLDGKRVLVRPSKASAMAFAVLGAIADPRNGDDAANAISRGDVAGAETSVDRPSGPQGESHAHVSTITANVQLSAKANVVIVNPDWWHGLTAGQQDAVREAATATRDWSTTQTVALAGAARDFCEQHFGDVAVADAAELAAWRRAVEPVVRDLAAGDPVTAAALDRIEEIVRAEPSTDVPSPCSMLPADDLPSVRPEGDQSVVAGQWRLLVSPEDFAAAGASPQDVANNQGVWTFTFAGDGSYSYVEPRGRSCGGTFAVAGDRMSLFEDTSVGDCDGHWEVVFHREGDQMTWTPTPEWLATYPPTTGFLAHPLELIASP
jgi:TRAP-type C4-dicarboxylate transport system substrate-binding protein